MGMENNCGIWTGDYLAAHILYFGLKYLQVIYKMAYISQESSYPYFCYNNSADKNLNLKNINNSDTNSLFNNQLEYSGSGYNTNGCIFTAPVKGAYYFYTHLCCVQDDGDDRNDDSVAWGIFVFNSDGTIKDSTRTITDDPEYRTDDSSLAYNMSFETVIFLDVGEKVKVSSNDADGGGVQKYLANKNYFMGYLISAFS
jgi:hypothetical protein